MQRALVVAALAMFAALLLGAAGDPLNLGTTQETMNRVRPGVPRHIAVEFTDANTNTVVMSVQPGSSVKACYPDGTNLKINAFGPATCCLAMAGSGITIGDQTTTSAGFVTDANGPDGNGACHGMPAGGEAHWTVSVASARTNYGARPGVCSAFTTIGNSVNGFRVRAPCRVDADCTGAGGAPAGTTCLLDSTNPAVSEADFRDACVFVHCRGLTAARVNAHVQH